MPVKIKTCKINYFASLPGILSILIPKCSICLTAYAGLLSSLGLGLFDYAEYLLPLTLVFLGTALFALAYRAKQRRGYVPFILGVIATGIMLFGKFQLDSDAAVYAGIILLLCASAWNSWPRKNFRLFCADCK